MIRHKPAFYNKNVTTFEYNSISKFGAKKEFPSAVLQEVQQYLLDKGGVSGANLGDLQDLLLDFRTKDGERLMIHQLEPIFIYIGIYGRVWE